MSTLKKVGVGIVGLIAVLIVVFALGYYVLGWETYFGPKFANVQRRIFTQTQSYQQGKMQDLAKYYDEYQRKTDVQSRNAIKTVIRGQFADFDANMITNQTLKEFLIEMRGF